MRKGVVPAGAELSTDADEKFEEFARRDIERLGPASLDQAFGFWRLLAKAHPSTRRRLIVECLRLSAAKKLPVPVKLISFVKKEFKTTTAPRSRVRTQDQMRDAARHLVRNPGSSYAATAEAIGTPGKKTTVASYYECADFWRFCAEERLLLDCGRQYEVLERYEKRFGRLRYSAALCYLVPPMLSALDKGVVLSRSTIKSAPDVYAKSQQPDALKEALAVHY